MNARSLTNSTPATCGASAFHFPDLPDVVCVWAQHLNFNHYPACLGANDKICTAKPITIPKRGPVNVIACRRADFFEDHFRMRGHHVLVTLLRARAIRVRVSEGRLKYHDSGMSFCKS